MRSLQASGRHRRARSPDHALGLVLWLVRWLRKSSGEVPPNNDTVLRTADNPASVELQQKSLVAYDLINFDCIALNLSSYCAAVNYDQAI